MVSVNEVEERVLRFEATFLKNDATLETLEVFRNEEMSAFKKIV